MPRTTLADILIDSGDLTPEQLTRAEALCAERQLPLSEVLLRQHMVSDDALLRAQGRQLGRDVLDGTCPRGSSTCR